MDKKFKSPMVPLYFGLQPYFEGRTTVQRRYNDKVIYITIPEKYNTKNIKEECRKFTNR